MTTPQYNKIAKALGLDEFSDDEREEFMLEFGDIVFRSSMIRLIERMDESTKNDFDALIARDPSLPEIEAFIEQRIPDADSAVKETVQALTDDILAVTTKK